MIGWKWNGWKILVKKLVKNVDLWWELDNEVVWYQVNWYWVKGYVGIFDNELVDELVNCGVVELVCV